MKLSLFFVSSFTIARESYGDHTCFFALWQELNFLLVKPEKRPKNESFKCISGH
jgi:hypothetical protein